MLVAGMVAIAFFGLVIFLLVISVDSLPKQFLKVLGYFLLCASSVELLILFWVLARTTHGSTPMVVIEEAA